MDWCASAGQLCPPLSLPLDVELRGDFFHGTGAHVFRMVSWFPTLSAGVGVRKSATLRHSACEIVSSFGASRSLKWNIECGARYATSGFEDRKISHRSYPVLRNSLVNQSVFQAKSDWSASAQEGAFIDNIPGPPNVYLMEGS